MSARTPKFAARFTPAQRERLRADVARLKTQRYLEDDIAAQLTEAFRKDNILAPDDEPINRNLVHYYWTELKKEWRRQREEAIDELQDETLLELEQMAAEAWRAWEASKDGRTDYERILTGDGDTGEMAVQRMRQTAHGGHGDVRYLELAIKAMERRARLLGLDAPARSEISGPGGQPLEIKAFDYAQAIAPILSEDEETLSSPGLEEDTQR
jgi:hypothetical protein